MYNIKEMSKRVRHLLGEPTNCVELTDESMESLVKLSVNQWKMLSTLYKLNIKSKKEIEFYWVESYFQALCKESLGMIRGKYEGILPIPGSDLKLNYKDLLYNAEQEKRNLESMFVPHHEKVILVIYLCIANLEEDSIQPYVNKILSKIKDPKIRYFVIPSRAEHTRIECLYPNFKPSKEVQKILNDKILSIFKVDITNEKQN